MSSVRRRSAALCRSWMKAATVRAPDEKVRAERRSQAVLVAIGINWEGRRNILASNSLAAKACRVGKSCWGGCGSAFRTRLPACLRLVRALAAETHESWIEAMPYLNMEPLREQREEGVAEGAEQSNTLNRRPRLIGPLKMRACTVFYMGVAGRQFSPTSGCGLV